MKYNFWFFNAQKGRERLANLFTPLDPPLIILVLFNDSRRMLTPPPIPTSTTITTTTITTTTITTTTITTTTITTTTAA